MTESRTSQLPVNVGRQEIGDIGRTREIRETSFRYMADAPEEAAVSLVMPVQRESYVTEGIAPVFSQNLPEGLLRAELMTMFSKTVRGFDDLDLLKIIGPHQLGRVTVGRHDDNQMPELSVTDLLLHDSALGLFEDLIQRYAAFSGVSGVQPKVLVSDNVSMDLDRLTHRGATHIVKAWRAEDYPELAANEYFCMLAAEYAGLEVPKVSLSANGKLLIVDRFDIAEGGYLGFEDMNSLSGWHSHQKYDGSYEGVSKQIKTFVSPDEVGDGLEALFRMVALSAGVRGGDFHLKNIGLIYDNCGPDAVVRVAPAFDIVSTTPYKQNDIMALKLAGSKNWPKHKLLADFGRRSCQLTEGRCRELLTEVADGMSKARVELVAYMQDHSSFEVVGMKMLDAWNRGPVRSLMPEGGPVVVDLGAKKGSGPKLG